MALSTTTTNSSSLHLYFVKKLLSVFEPRTVLYPLGVKTSLPKNTGKQVKWLQYSRIASSTTALTEGTTPSEVGFTTANITATIAQYGQFAKVTDLLEWTAIDPVLQSLTDRFADAAYTSVEDLCIAALDAVLTAQYANGAANANALTAQDTQTMKELVKAMISLKNAFVPAHEKGKYIAVLHPSHEYDLINETNVGSWLDNSQTLSGEGANILNGEVARPMFGMRFTVSDQMTAAANGSSVSIKSSYVLGRECFGVVDIDKDNVKMILKDAKSGGTSNPLELFSTVGYKIPGFVAKNFAAGRGRQVFAAAGI